MAEGNEHRRTDGGVTRNDEGPFVHALELVAPHHRVGRAERRQLAAVQQGDPRRETRDEVQLVTHEQDGATLAPSCS